MSSQQDSKMAQLEMELPANVCKYFDTKKTDIIFKKAEGTYERFINISCLLNVSHPRMKAFSLAQESWIKFRDGTDVEQRAIWDQLIR